MSGAAAMTTVQYVVAVGFALVLFVALTNLVVDMYARGVVRAAVDEGARAGARLDAGSAECERRAASVLEDLLGPDTRSGVRVSCSAGDGIVVARAGARLRAWVPGLVPDWSFTVERHAVREPRP